MSGRLEWAGWTWLLLGLCAAVGGTGLGCENAHVKAAREYLADEDYTEAARELRIAMRDGEKEDAVRGLYLFALSAGEGGEAALARDTLDEYVTYRELAKVLDEEDGDRGEAVRELVATYRKRLYDAGIKTEGMDDLLAVLRAAGRAAFDSETADDRFRMRGAVILAADGDEAALSFLVDQLKSEKKNPAMALLRVGKPVIAPLREAAMDSESLVGSLGRRTLCELLTIEAYGEYADAWPRATPVDAVGVPENLASATFSEAFGYGRITDDKRMLLSGHAGIGVDAFAGRGPAVSFVDLGGEGANERWLVVLQGRPEGATELKTALHLCADGALAEVSITTEAGKVSSLNTLVPIAFRAMEENKNDVELVEPALVPTEHERLVSKSGFRKGERVALASSKRSGHVDVADPYGVVTLTWEDTGEPGRVHRSKLRGIIVETRRGAGVHVTRGKLKEGKLELGGAMKTAPGAALSAPKGMAYVPSGVLRFGSAPEDEDRLIDEAPETPMFVPGFFMDLYEFPNVAGVVARVDLSGDDAASACQEVGKRLCSELEWERACKGPDELRFPYGDSYEKASCYVVGDDAGDITESGKRASCKSGFGVYDLSGNAAELTRAADETMTKVVVARGGSVRSGRAGLRCATRVPVSTETRANLLGFRCCRDAR